MFPGGTHRVSHAPHCAKPSAPPGCLAAQKSHTEVRIFVKQERGRLARILKLGCRLFIPKSGANEEAHFVARIKRQAYCSGCLTGCLLGHRSTRVAPSSAASSASMAAAAQPSHGLPAADLLRTRLVLSLRGRRSVLHAGGSPHSRDHSRLEKRRRKQADGDPL
jgi:hypothetical protein